MGSNENFARVIKPLTIQGGLRPGGAISKNRRALSTIDQNIIDAPSNRCAVNKKGILARENAITCKNPVVATRCPVTRTFSTQSDIKEQQTTFRELQPPYSTRIDDCIVTDANNDNDELMYVHHTEAMLQEIDQMDTEVEMEDIRDEMVIDIDSSDKKNPLAVTEYIDDIYAHYKKTEGLSCVPANYMMNQFDINERMRAILIDWLIEVHYKFELMGETLYLTVNLIDRFLAVQSVVRKKLQLVGITALLIACKYEEVSVPVVYDLILISGRAYCRQDILDMEKLMMNTLQFNLSLPTPYVFMRRFLKAAQSDRRLELLSFYIIELCLVEYEMVRFEPSMLAAAAIFTAQCSLEGCEQWSRTSEMHSNYSRYQLLECAKLMVSLHEKAGSGKLMGVYKKYSTSKYEYAAKVAKPATFLIDA